MSQYRKDVLELIRQMPDVKQLLAQGKTKIRETTSVAPKRVCVGSIKTTCLETGKVSARKAYVRLWGAEPWFREGLDNLESGGPKIAGFGTLEFGPEEDCPLDF